jgi:hypothetical protein
MVQAVKEPNVVGNQVAFNAFGVIPGEVTLEGEQTARRFSNPDSESFRKPSFLCSSTLDCSVCPSGYTCLCSPRP